MPHRVLCLLLLASPLWPASVKRHFSHFAQSIGNRNRLHINSLITDPGTLELESAFIYSEIGNYAAPVLLKYTPSRGSTELSVGFDSWRGSSDVALAANTLLYDGSHWNVVLGPSLVLVRQNGDGLRPGATFITRYDNGLASLGLSATWSKATRPTDNNPADQTAFGIGGGLRLGKEGWRSHWTLNSNALNERASSTRAMNSTFEGLEWELNSRLSINLVAQQLDWRGPNRDNQALVGLTVNFGHIRLH